MMNTATSVPRVNSAARALAILVEVAGSAQGLTAKELSERLGISRQTVYHLVHTLAGEGFLARGVGRTYRLGLRVGTLAHGFARQLASPESYLPQLRALVTETGEAAYVSGWRDDEIAMFGQLRGEHAVSVSELHIGLMVDAHARAAGKLLLAYASAATRNEYLRAHPARRRTASTIEPAALEHEFDSIRSQGFAADLEEFQAGVCCLAAPLDGGASPFAVSLSAPTERFRRNYDAYVRAIQKVASGV